MADMKMQDVFEKVKVGRRIINRGFYALVRMYLFLGGKHSNTHIDT